MIYFFRKIRKKLIFKNKSVQYLKYGLGEVFLVVIGILIALQLDNWNDQRKFNNALLSIQQRIILDIDNDINELNNKIYFLERQQPLFNMVYNDAVSEKLIAAGYPYLLRTMPYTSFNISGIQQLKNLKVNDAHSQKIINIYDRMTNSSITPVEQEYNLRINKVIASFTQYAWFPEWSAIYVNPELLNEHGDNTDSKALTAFFMSDISYKNQVILNSYQLFNSYIPTLKNAITELEAIKSELIFKLRKHAIEPTIDDLNKYVGEYKIISIEGNPLTFDINEQINIKNVNDAILFASENQLYIMAYNKVEHRFSFIDNNTEVHLTFVNGETEDITGASLLIKSNNETSKLTLNRTALKTD